MYDYNSQNLDWNRDLAQVTPHPCLYDWCIYKLPITENYS